VRDTSCFVSFICTDYPLKEDEMYFWSGKRWVCKRGTSSQENYHLHLGNLVNGNNTSEELFCYLVNDFNNQWNVRRGIDNGEEPDYGTTNLYLLNQIKKVCLENGWRDPLPALPFI
jgi:hypothetical protein